MTPEDPKNIDGENAVENIDFSKNITVVGTNHYLTPEEKIRIEQHVKDADFVCMEWDQIRDNEAKGLSGGYSDYFHLRPFLKAKLTGDHLRRGILETFEQDYLRNILSDKISSEAKKNGGSSDGNESNEFLYIQILCEKYGKPFYFVDMPITHTKYRLLKAFERDGISIESFDRVSMDRSAHMAEESQRICRERFAETGKEEKAVLFVGSAHLKDFRGNFKKAEPVETDSA